MNVTSAFLRRDAEKKAAGFPSLLVAAEKLAAVLRHGAHGRQQAGRGENFWQYRPALPGDEMSCIDWRRSGRSDGLYVRQTEWEAPQSVQIWVDSSLSMAFTSHNETKADRAAVLGLALGILLARGGEQVALPGTFAARAGTGETQIQRMAEILANRSDNGADYGTPPSMSFKAGGQAVLISDFLGELADIEKAMTLAAQAGSHGVLLQVLDPAEQNFPYEGRVHFESMGGSLQVETPRASALRTAYQEKLSRHQSILRDMAIGYGWQFASHQTGQSAQNALLWLYGALSRKVI